MSVPNISIWRLTLMGSGTFGLEAAAELMPDSAEYNSYLGYAVYFSSTGTPKEKRERAIRYLKLAQRLDDQLDKSYLFLGKIFKKEQELSKAQEQFQLATQKNSKCYEAIQELRDMGVNI